MIWARSARCWSTIRSFRTAPISPLAQVVSREHLIVRTWERGAGLTRACGSAACAAAVCAARTKRTGRKVTVTLPGGDLAIEWREADDHVLMTGPVEYEFEGRFDPALFEAGAARRRGPKSWRGPMSVDVLTFGCRLNTYESEVIRRHAAAAGLADVVVVNTCAVTAEAERQARQAIRKAKRERPQARIIVTGCAAQTSPESFAAMAEVDRVIGNDDKIAGEAWIAAREALARPPDFGIGSEQKIVVNDIMSVKETAAHLIEGLEGRSRAYVQVQNGCDHRCTFCIIPFGRGNSRSVPMGEVVTQVRRLADNGYREVVLTGVDLTSYGADLPGAPKLGTLVRQILRHAGSLERLRLSSLDCVEIDDELFAAFAEEPRLMPHLHLSLQAGDDLILKRMKRRHSRAASVALCERLRRLAPRHGVRRRHHRRLSHRDRGDVCALARPRRRLRAHLPACVSLFAAAGNAGGAHAAGRPRGRQGPRPALARSGRGGAAPPSRRRGRRTSPRAHRDRRQRTQRAFHPGAVRAAGRARHRH